MTVPKRFLSHTFCIFICMILSVSCNGESSTQSSAQESELKELQVTATQPSAGSAKLYYQLVTKNPPFFTAVETDVIPLNWKFDPDNPKQEQEIITSVDDGSFFVQIAANSEGNTCFFWFDIPVEIGVFGNYKPGPECSFDFTITATSGTPIVRSGQNCGPEADAMYKQYPAEILFIPPPNKVISMPGTLTITIPVDELTTIKLTLTDVVVPEATGCQWQ